MSAQPPPPPRFPRYPYASSPPPEARNLHAPYVPYAPNAPYAPYPHAPYLQGAYPYAVKRKRYSNSFLLVVGIVAIALFFLLGIVNWNQSNNRPDVADGEYVSPDNAAIQASLNDLAQRDLHTPPPAYTKPNQGTSAFLLSYSDSGYQRQETTAAKSFGPFLFSPWVKHISDWESYPEPGPGMTLDINEESVCTMAFVGHYADESDPAALTAGHCMAGDTDSVMGWPDPTHDYASEPLGTWDVMQSFDEEEVRADEESQRFSSSSPHPHELPQLIGEPGDSDYSIIALDKHTAINPLIDERFTVTTVAGAADLHQGMMVCKFGFRTGETCGPIVAWNEYMVRANIYSQNGDSGSPLYIRLGGNRVAALGILSSSPVNENEEPNDYVTDFALVQPVLDATDMELGLPD